jgi:hypothetical protein
MQILFLGCVFFNLGMQKKFKGMQKFFLGMQKTFLGVQNITTYIYWPSFITVATARI